jgi:hypothetical protein
MECGQQSKAILTGGLPPRLELERPCPPHQPRTGTPAPTEATPAPAVPRRGRRGGGRSLLCLRPGIRFFTMRLGIVSSSSPPPPTPCIVGLVFYHDISGYGDRAPTGAGLGGEGWTRWGGGKRRRQRWSTGRRRDPENGCTEKEKNRTNRF